MSQPTPQQQAAITATGGVLLSAGAGTGKTATLIARCLRLILEEGVNVDELLVVTFTNAAAEEMKQRLREALQARLAGQPEDARLRQQVLLLEGAHISTIHSFCFELLRAHFAELQLDPGVVVLEESITRPLEKTIARQVVLHAIDQPAVRQLAQLYCRDSGEQLAEQIRKVYQFYVKQPQAETCLANERQRWEQTTPEDWQAQREEIIKAWLLEWQKPAAWQIPQILEALPSVKGYGGQSPTAAGLRRIEEQLPEFGRQLAALSEASSFDEAAAAFDLARQLSGSDFWVRGTGNKRGLLKPFFEEAAELAAWLPSADGDPLQVDWERVRQPMQTLLELTQDFAREFSEAKRALGGVDFSDLEQLALQLLEKEAPIAAAWRQRFKHVLVDECQDINAAQDALLQRLSRRGDQTNLFMVGDVKQSIYRFRLAAPELFQGYTRDWQNQPHHQVLALNENFRSRAALLDFVNDLFHSLLASGWGGMSYGEDDRLHFGQPEGDRSPLAHHPPEGCGPEHAWADADCRVELHLVQPAAEGGEEKEGADSGDDDWGDLLALEQEARVVAGRLRELMDGRHQVWDKRERRFREMRWSDVGLLLRAVRGRAGAFLREFRRQHIPLVAEQGDFLDTLEAQDLIALLRVLDNPRQDIPLFALLRSPLVGLSLDEMVAVRQAGSGPDPWRRLASAQDNPTIEKFLIQLDRWRRLALISSLSVVLETVLAETRYEAFLLTLADGPERVANVRRFLDLARRYDPLQRQGLHRFLRFITDQQEAEEAIEPLPPRQTDAVRLLSIHKSKGLEFPIVVLANMGAKFNQSQRGENILFSRRLEVVPQVVDPAGKLRYDSLARWWVSREEKRESAAEELRLFYVAVTRARDTLILVGNFQPESKSWKEHTGYPPELGVGLARCYGEWLGLWLADRADWANGKGEVEFPNARLRWRVHDGGGAPPATADEMAPGTLPTLTVEQLTSFAWTYQHHSATTAPAKTSASALRHLGGELDEDTTELSSTPAQRSRPVPRRDSRMTAAEVGTAHHKFVQYVDLARVGTTADLAAEAGRLRAAGILSEPEVAALDLIALHTFWQSELGREIVAQEAGKLRRELRFTAAFSPAELSAFAQAFPVIPDETVVVQGAVDLAVLHPTEIWIVDLKTDHIRPEELRARADEHAPQLRLYAAALKRIYNRPVTRATLYFLQLGQSVEVAG